MSVIPGIRPNLLALFLALTVALVAMGCSGGGDRNNDPDGDGLENALEQQLGTNPDNPDSDGDGLNDGAEVNRYGTSPTNPDSDNDGLNDGAEVNQYATDPSDRDSDGDGLFDGDEIGQFGTDPALRDTDGDGFDDREEVIAGTDPHSSDTDGDGLTDGDEAHNRGTNPKRADTDGDGRTDKQEIDTGSNPFDPDSDNDGLSDGDEALYGTDANDPDSDNDGLNDGDEVVYGANPLNDDSDSDTLKDGDEVARGTNPASSDSDNDGIVDNEELGLPASTDPTNPDSDSDGLNDGAEIALGLDPLDPDFDKDGLLDGDEISAGTRPDRADTDADSVPDGAEVAAGIDPLQPDSDSDGLYDGDEVVDGWNGYLLTAGIPQTIDFSAPFRVYVELEGLPDPQGNPIQNNASIVFGGVSCQFDVALARQWYGCSEATISASLAVSVNITPGSNIVTHTILAAPVTPYSTHHRPTLASNPDSDGDNLADGRETRFETYWIETEHAGFDTNAGALLWDESASSGALVEVSTATLNAMGADPAATALGVVPGSTLTRVEPDPLVNVSALHYGLYIRASGDGSNTRIKGLLKPLMQAADGSKVVDPAGVMFECESAPRNLYNWLACRAPPAQTQQVITLPPAGIEIELQALQNQNTSAILPLRIDRLVLAPFAPPQQLDGALGAPSTEAADFPSNVQAINHIPRHGSVAAHITDPLDRDTDRDGVRIVSASPTFLHPGLVLNDGNELSVIFTNPFTIDSDDDADIYPEGVSTPVSGGDWIYDDFDPSETYGGNLQLFIGADRLDRNDSNPRSNDADADGQRITVDLNDADADIDDDGLRDGREDRGGQVGTDGDLGTPPAHLDANNEIDGAETWRETSRVNSDSDGDGVTDGIERGVLLPPADTAVAPAGCPQPLPIDPLALTNLNVLVIHRDSNGFFDPFRACFDAQNNPRPLFVLGSGLRRYSRNSNPLATDSDGDGLDDGEEDKNADGYISAGESDPSRADSDADGIDDYAEVNGTLGYVTDPIDEDSDGDGIHDRDEIEYGCNQAQPPLCLDPTNPDSDGDGLNDGAELEHAADPLVSDSDGDGLSDKAEVDFPCDQNVPPRCLDPNHADSDRDGISDGEEVIAGQDGFVTNPLDADTDGDFLSDAAETVTEGEPEWPQMWQNYCVAPSIERPLLLSTRGNPTLTDSDGDGFSDSEEVCCRSDPGAAGSRPVIDLRLEDGSLRTNPPIVISGDTVRIGAKISNRSCLTVSPLAMTATGSGINAVDNYFLAPFSSDHLEVNIGSTSAELDLFVTVQDAGGVNGSSRELDTGDNSAFLTVPVYPRALNLSADIVAIHNLSLFGGDFEVSVQNPSGITHNGQVNISSLVSDPLTGLQVGGVPGAHLISPQITEVQSLGGYQNRLVSVSWPGLAAGTCQGSGDNRSCSNNSNRQCSNDTDCLITEIDVNLTLHPCKEAPLSDTQPSPLCTAPDAPAESDLLDNSANTRVNLDQFAFLPASSGARLTYVNAITPRMVNNKPEAATDADIVVHYVGDGQTAGIAQITVEMQADGQQSPTALGSYDVFVHLAKKRQRFVLPGKWPLPRGVGANLSARLEAKLPGNNIQSIDEFSNRQLIYYHDPYVQDVRFIRTFGMVAPAYDTYKDELTPLEALVGNLGGTGFTTGSRVHLYLDRNAPTDAADCGLNSDYDFLKGSGEDFEFTAATLPGDYFLEVQVCDAEDRWFENNTLHVDYTVGPSLYFYGWLKRYDRTSLTRGGSDTVGITIWDTRPVDQSHNGPQPFDWRLELHINGDSSLSSVLAADQQEEALQSDPWFLPLNVDIDWSTLIVGTHHLVLYLDDLAVTRLPVKVLPKITVEVSDDFTLSKGKLFPNIFAALSGQSTISYFDSEVDNRGVQNLMIRANASDTGCLLCVTPGPAVATQYYLGGQYQKFEFDAGQAIDGSDWQGSQWRADIEVRYLANGGANEYGLNLLPGITDGEFYYTVAGVLVKGTPYNRELYLGAQLLDSEQNSFDLEGELKDLAVDLAMEVIGLVLDSTVFAVVDITLDLVQFAEEANDCDAGTGIVYKVTYRDVPIVDGADYSTFVQLDGVVRAISAGVGTNTTSEIAFSDRHAHYCRDPQQDDGLKVMSIKLLDARPPQ